MSIKNVKLLKKEIGSIKRLTLKRIEKMGFAEFSSGGYKTAFWNREKNIVLKYSEDNDKTGEIFDTDIKNYKKYKKNGDFVYTEFLKIGGKYIYIQPLVKRDGGQAKLKKISSFFCQKYIYLDIFEGNVGIYRKKQILIDW